MVQHRDRTDVLLLGSSLFQEGVSSELIEDKIVGLTANDVDVFNGSSAGANVRRLNYLVNEVVKVEGISIIAVETYGPPDKTGGLGFESDSAATDFEGKLHEFFSSQLDFVRWRKSLRLQNLIKVSRILAADHLQGGEYIGFKFFGEYLFPEDAQATVDRYGIFDGQVIYPEESSTDTIRDVIDSLYVDMSVAAQKHGVQLLLIAPPSRADMNNPEAKAWRKGRYQHLSNLTGAIVFYYGHLAPPAELFRDGIHLNATGRVLFSYSLGELFADLIRKKGAEGVIQ